MFYREIEGYSGRGYANLAAFKGHVRGRLATCGNARLYDFQAYTAISGDLRNYKDATHYSAGVARRIIDGMHDGGATALPAPASAPPGR